MQFQPQKYGAAVADLLTDEPLCALGPGTPIVERRSKLSALDENAVVAPHPLADPDMARCCISGLWLLYDFLDESHRISQNIHTSSGSYWHGIMHRREPDYSNSKYWFRKAGDHAIFDSLCRAADELAANETLDAPSQFLIEQSAWDPFRFIDLCESVARGRSSTELLCKRIAQIEWRLLFDHCYDQAVGA